MAYAAMINLRRHTFGNHDKIDSICSTLDRLDDECYRGIDRSEIHELDAKIRDAAWKLEDVIDSHLLSRGADGTAGLNQEIHSFFETVKKLGEEYERALQNSSCVAEEDIIDHDDNSTTVGVGVPDLSEQIIRGLRIANSESQIFSISGMAGIGKTHLARSIYHHPLIVQHFDLRLWVRMGPIHKDLKNVFVDILSQIEGKPRDVFKEKDEDELSHLLRSLLHDRKYLIAFDDIWSQSVLIDCLNALSFHKNDECKALITTRILGLAETHYGNQDCQMPFLSDEESWDLLRQNVFVEKPFPTQLEKPGRKIAEICEGLPLLILVVADILRGLDETEDCWNKVAQKKTTSFTDAYDRIYKVLIPSYDYLPQKYKASFLYLGMFRQSREISTSKLLKLWVVEGLYVDNELLPVLISNSVVINCEQEFHIVHYCKLHSVYWYMCVTEARKTKLFHVLIKLSDVSVERPRRLSVQNNILFGLKEVCDSMAVATSSTRSLLFSGEYHQYQVQICFNTMILMKVLDALEIRFYKFPNEVTNLLLLRYLALNHHGEVPSSISNLQRLRFLILRRHHNIINMLHRDSRTCLPKEIWDNEKLFYLHIIGSNLPNPTHGVELPNLKLLYVNADSCTESVFRGTPKLYKLGIKIELQPEDEEEYLRCLEHIGILNELESLNCEVVNPRLSSQVVAPPNHLSNLPANLKRMCLKGLGYPWKYISAIASLPCLVKLKLQCSAFQGAVWEIKDGEFLNLKYLLLEDIDVVTISVDGRGLQNLNHLNVDHCYKLKTILFSANTKMKRIAVDECSPSIVKLAQQMKADDPNHPHLKDVIINYSWNL